MASTRRNGLIRIPELLYSQVCTQIIDVIYTFRDGMAAKLDMPVAKRRMTSFIPSAHQVYGVPFPPFLLTLIFSKNETEEVMTTEGPQQAFGWLIPENPETLQARSEIVLVITPRAARAPESAIRGELGATVQHELRHLIQFELSRNMADAFKAGGPTRKARTGASYSDREYQPHLGDLVFKYRSYIENGYTTVDRALREIGASDLLQTFKEETPERWKAAMRIAHDELSKIPVRENGVIRLPEQLVRDTAQAAENLLYEFWEPSRKLHLWGRSKKVPSSAADPRGRDESRIRHAWVPSGYDTYGGRKTPRFVLELWLSKEGYESPTPDKKVHAWFSRVGLRTGGHTLAICLAVSLEDVNGPEAAVRNPAFLENLRHELRHLIQVVVATKKPFDVTQPLPAVRGGAPPRKASVSYLRKKYGPLDASGYSAYVQSDVEFQPHLATLAERYAEAYKNNEMSYEHALQSASDSDLLAHYRKQAPEKWKAAVRIVDSELRKADRLRETPAWTGHRYWGDDDEDEGDDARNNPARAIRRNGVIRIPESLFSETEHQLRKLMFDFWTDRKTRPPQTAISSASDPNRRDRNRMQAGVVSAGHKTYKGLPTPPLILEVWLSKEGVEDGSRGWFTWTRVKKEGVDIPRIGIAVSLNEVRYPNQAVKDQKLQDTLRHELRHFIQYVLDPKAADPSKMRAGGPPVRATTAREFGASHTPAYIGLDVEFQPHLGTLVESLKAKHASGKWSEDALMKEALNSSLLKAYRAHSPEKWRAAVQIIAGVLHPHDGRAQDK